MKIVCVILFLLRRVFGVSIVDADGTNFEDTFKRFESALWRRDRGSRQVHPLSSPTFGIWNYSGVAGSQTADAAQIVS